MLAPCIVDINDAIGALSKMRSRLIGEDIELAVQFAASGQVHIDPSQLERLLINPVVNARDAMPEGSKLTIRSARHGVLSSGMAFIQKPIAIDQLLNKIRDMLVAPT